MRYNEQINLKLFTYENSAFIQQAIIDDYQEISFAHNLYEAGDFTITINYNIPNALKFERGMFVQFGNDPYMFGEILTINDAIGEDGKGSQIRTITGKDARYIFKRRIIKNLNNVENWAMTAKGELCLRNLINDQCGSGAETKRQLPIINTIPDSASALGKEYSVAEAFSNLYDTLVTIATQSEIGWRIKFDGNLTLEVYQGTDLSNQVQFSTDFDSLSNGEFSDSAESFANTIYVGGKGTGNDRDIYEGESAISGESPAGLERYEAWDNQSSMTTESEYEAEALSMLTQYGQTINVSGQGLAKCPYEFKKEYNIGDTIILAFSGKSANVQILSVTEHWVWGQYGIEFNFGKPQNDLSRQLQLILKQIQKASNKTKTTESIKYYTIPTDTQMPSADVVYDRIGFTGACASGGSTFKLYLDDEKTGAKTYHVYFKELTGGKLTLTTGKAGAQDLVMNSGTYVSIIYVDAEGNVSTAGMTATSSVTSGNTQPVTSGAVAEQLTVETSTDSTPYVQRINADKDKAVINKLIGASFANNQVVQNGNFADTSNWSSGVGTLSVSNNVARITYVSGIDWNQDLRQAMPNIVQGHKYYAKLQHREGDTFPNIFALNELVSNTTYFSFSHSTSWATIEKVFEPTSPNKNYPKRITPTQAVENYGGRWFEISNFFIIDLTQMFGSAIADRIYAMERSSAGSGVAWIKSFGFFNKSYYDYSEGSILSVKPSAHKVSASVARSWRSRNVYSQYTVCLFADALLKPNTNYTLYFRGANGADIYVNENLFGSQVSVVLDGTLQSKTYTTLGSLPSDQKMTESGLEGWIIFKNRQGNTVVPNFTEFYICEEGVNADPSFSASYSLADAELRGIPQLDTNNNLTYDGDIYLPSGDIIRKYGVVTVNDFTGNHLSSASEGGLGYIDTSVSVKGEVIDYIRNNCNLPTKNGNAGWTSTEPCIATLGSGNNNLIRIYETLNMTLSQFQTKYANLEAIYKKLTPTRETVAGYTNPQTCIRQGAEEFVDTRTVPIPVGHETEYAKLPQWLGGDSILL